MVDSGACGFWNEKTRVAKRVGSWSSLSSLLSLQQTQRRKKINSLGPGKALGLL